MTLIQDKSIARFWRSMRIAGPDECWPWLGKINVRGYGATKMMGRNVGAHRIALAFATERLPGPSEFALHSCDNPICCNPHHLRWGTHAENMRDMEVRGRHRWGTARRTGEANPRAKLTWGAVAEIRRSSSTTRDLAQTYGVGQTTILDIRARRRWTDEAPSPDLERLSGGERL